MYARGATPEMRRPAAAVSTFPAAIPATCVPWLESSGLNASRALGEVTPLGANTRATITFAVVNRSWPFGKPEGIVYPDGSKYGWLGSTPESMIPIFMPWPALSRVGPQRPGAPIWAALDSDCAAYVAEGRTRRTPGSAPRRPSSARGR